MHAEDQNLRPRVTQTYASNQWQAAKILCVDLKIDHHHVGMAPVIESIAGYEITSFEHYVNSCILEDAPASIEDDWMIIDHEDASHNRFVPAVLPANKRCASSAEPISEAMLLTFANATQKYRPDGWQQSPRVAKF
jgi:hypothetical protein